MKTSEEHIDRLNEIVSEVKGTSIEYGILTVLIEIALILLGIREEVAKLR